MSQSLYVMSNHPLDDIAAWQNYVNRSGFDLKFNSGDYLIQHKGYLSAHWQGRESGFEFSPIEMGDIIEAYPDYDFHAPWAQAYAFYYGTASGCVGANIAAAVLAESTAGIVFDPQEGHLMSSAETNIRAKKLEIDFYRYGFSKQT